MESIVSNPNVSCPLAPSAPAATLKSSVLHERSMEGQAHRERFLRGKKVLFVSCGQDTTKSNVYETCQRLGVEMYLLESLSNRFASILKANGIVSEARHIKLDLSMRSTLLDECTQAINKAIPEGPDAIVTFWDDCVGLAARLAEQYNVISNSVESIDSAHDKYLSRTKLCEAGIPVPQHFRISNEDELRVAAREMTYPAILKPVQGAASIGVSMVKSETECIEGYYRTLTMMERVLKDGDLMGLVFDTETSASSTFVLEEFIDGEEVDVDMVLWNGEARYANVNSDWPDGGRFIELGITFPAKCNDGPMGSDFKKAALDCCRALGIKDGVVHVELKYSTKYGPCLIECNPRLGGGPLYAFHNKAYGIDLVVEHLLVMNGIAPNFPVFEKNRAYCSCIFLYAPRDGVIKGHIDSTSAANEFRKMDHVTDVKFTITEGDKVNGWSNLEAFPSYVGRVDLAVDSSIMTYDEVTEYCKAMSAEALKCITYR